MKFVLLILILFHALIHLFGFAKAFNLAAVQQLVQPISKINGVLWLASALLLGTTALLLWFQKDTWWICAAAAVLLSQYLIFTSWQDAKFGTLANVLIAFAAFVGFGTARFVQAYTADVHAGIQQTAAQQPTLLTEADLQPLPVPVQQYLRYVGAVGRPKVHSFKVAFVGQIRKNEQSEWMPFTSEQYNFMEVPTRLFFMKATMKQLPVAGYHAYKNGTAFMDIRLLSLLKVQYQTGKEMDRSETVTFFNDMCCMAPATLIDKRIQWLETEGQKVKAAFTVNGITITAWLYFNEAGALVNFISNDRYATGDNNTVQLLPWSTPLKDYKVFNGHTLPGYAETIYTYPEGDFCYGTFQLAQIVYNKF